MADRTSTDHTEGSYNYMADHIICSVYIVIQPSYMMGFEGVYIQCTYLASYQLCFMGITKYGST